MKPFDYAFTAGAKEYILRYSFQARHNFERKTGQSVPGMLKKLSNPETQTAEELIAMFSLLLATKQPDMTTEQIEQMLDELGEDEAMTLLTKAIGGDDTANP